MTRYTSGITDDFFTCEYDTKDEAIAELHGAHGYVGTVVPYEPLEIFNIDKMIVDTLKEEASEYCGEVADDWLLDATPEMMRELRESLNRSIASWIFINGLEPGFFLVNNIEEVNRD